MSKKDEYNLIQNDIFLFRQYLRGLVVAQCDNVPDALYIDRDKEEIMRISQEIGEPILFRMGDDLEQLYVPDTEFTQKMCDGTIPKGGSWMPVVSRKAEKLVSEGMFERGAPLFSGANATQGIKYTLDVGMGENLETAQEHLNELGNIRGLEKISLEKNGGIIVYPEINHPGL
ncbi:MAG: DUF3450 domain-containing protein [Alphaproteobacteria bacterium]|nr:DUF3450 domain-containing protein [Alphaproteobacteria bacterium]